MWDISTGGVPNYLAMTFGMQDVIVMQQVCKGTWYSIMDK